MFVMDAQLAQWEAALPSLQDGARLHLMVRLAWHLRQRDVTRARSLAHAAGELLALLPDPERSRAEARLMLIEGEAKWLFGEHDAARALADQACIEFDQQGDAIGSADARWLRAWLEIDRGNAAVGEHELASAGGYVRQSGDPLRIEVFDAGAAVFACYVDLGAATEQWAVRFDARASGAHLAVNGWIRDYQGSSAFQGGDFGAAVGPLTQAYEAARATGQLRRAINLASNIGNALINLNAQEAALEWMQRGLELARTTHWPISVGLALMQTAQTLRQLGQRAAALALLDEALVTLAPLPQERAYAIALEYHGDLALDGGDYERALESFHKLEERGVALGQLDFQSGARRGQAHALSSLNRPQAALAKADAALALAREHDDTYNQIAALTVLALIHTRHALPAPDPMFGPNAALHFLRQAMAVAATIDGYSIPADLLDAVASEYAGVGEHARAYEVALQASAAREAAHLQQAANRAAALRVQHQGEAARNEAAHQRGIAAADALRAEVQRQTSATLEHLVAIGQEITTHLEASAVYRALARHVHGLLDGAHLSIFVVEADGDSLSCAYSIDDGRPASAACLSLTGQGGEAARCVRERREILIERVLAERVLTESDGAQGEQAPVLSELFAPLLIGERVLGAMTVQSQAAHAYGERERLIFRSLCSYGAIALDNANAYRQVAATLTTLSATQAQLVEKNLALEKAYQALEELSLTDQLTGLRNRRFFLQHVEGDVGMALRHHDDPLRSTANDEHCGPGRDMVFFMVDLDHFKDVNDVHGHAAGDAVLVQMQERLREVFRESDYLIRWGGEEFLVLARATHRDDAKVVAERIRQAVAKRTFVLADGTELAKTCSIGFACFPFVPEEPRLLSWSEVVELADQALYLVKRSGRDGWAGIYSTPESQFNELFPRLVTQLAQAVAGGEAKVVTNLAHLEMPGAREWRVTEIAATTPHTPHLKFA
ncbi:diguanylate cyclase [Massilia sp. TSP1-1-2]|uniref:diguanylate cyclase n=1 Tax=Massilia sp. TSP1-1-2 TaxID=2804649 RepID=UPI003CFA5F1A